MTKESCASDVRWPASVVCFGGEDWWYHNRGHCDMQLMRQFARHGRVLYVNSVVMRRPNITEGRMFFKRVVRKARSMTRGLVPVARNFSVYSPFTAPVRHLPAARAVNDRILQAQVLLAIRKARLGRPLVWVNCPAACDTALALPRTHLVYQRTDRYEDYPGVDAQQVHRDDCELKRRADLTFFSNRALLEAEREQCRRAVYVPHGVDYDRFAAAAGGDDQPAELRRIARPIVGFFGGIDGHTFNLPLIADVVERLPDVSFVFVGSASIDLAALTRHRNVVRIDRQPYERIPHFGRCFDVCIMPFNLNRWIQACNPVKLKEYLALGKPVVTTPFDELAAYDGLVRIAAEPAAFAEAIRRALEDNSPAAIAARRDFVRPHTWYNKASDILTALHQDGPQPDHAAAAQQKLANLAG